jgi:hypothetical protein
MSPQPQGTTFEGKTLSGKKGLPYEDPYTPPPKPQGSREGAYWGNQTGDMNRDLWRGGKVDEGLVGAGTPMVGVHGTFDPLHINLTGPDGERKEYVTDVPKISYAGPTVGAGTAQ